MKKILGIVLALTLAAALAVPAFAGDQSFNTGSGSADVGINADYVAATDNTGNVTKVYALTLSWVQTGSLTYNAGKTTYTWNQGNLAYDSEVTEKGWSGTAAITITAKNRSNAAVDVSCANPTAASGLTITGSYAGGTSVMELPTAATGFTTPGAMQTKSVTYNIAEGEVTGTYSGTGNIGTITVTVTGK